MKPAPQQTYCVLTPKPGNKSHIGERPVAVVVIEVGSVVREVGFENIEPAVAVVVAHADAHAGLLLPVFVVSAPGHHRDVFERPVVFVVK